MSAYDSTQARTRSDRRTYWAAVEDADELAGELRRKIDAYYSALADSGRLARWQRVEALYYGRDADSDASSHKVSESGEQGETLVARSNHLRSVIRQSITLTTGTRQAIVAKSDNADYESAEERRLAEAILTHDLARGTLNYAPRRATEYAHTHGEGWVVQVWDEDAGERFGVEPYVAPEDEPKVAEYQAALAEYDQRAAMALANAQASGDPYRTPAGADIGEPPAPPDIRELYRVRYAGDVTAFVPHPADVIRDPDVEDPHDSDWYGVRRRVSRHKLAAKYPDFEDDILNAPVDDKDYQGAKFFGIRQPTSDSDLVTAYTLYHKPCHALPWGLRVVMVAEKVVERDQLGYSELPVFPIFPNVEGTSPFGYGPAFDLIALQQMYDAALSAVLTNLDALQFQKFWVPTGADIEEEDLTGGVKLLKGGTVPPVALKALEGVLDKAEWLDFLQRQIETVSGMNGVARGNPDTIKAGVALAFQAALAVQASSDIQQAYGELLEKVATARIEIYQARATTERVVEIAGKKNATKASKWSGRSISSVRRVTVDLGNPALRTASGRVDIAEKLLSHPTQPISPDQFLEVIASGRLDPVTEAPDSEMTCIAMENELLLQGVNPPTYPTDDPRKHVQEHRILLNDPNLRMDPSKKHILDATIEHIMGHARVAERMQLQDTVLMELLGYAPLQSVMAMAQLGAPPPQAPGASAAPAGPPGGAPPPSDDPSAPRGPLPGVEGVPGAKLPGLPPNAPAGVRDAAMNAGIPA